VVVGAGGRNVTADYQRFQGRLLWADIPFGTKQRELTAIDRAILRSVPADVVAELDTGPGWRLDHLLAADPGVGSGRRLSVAGDGVIRPG
jgi:hypothetical protein